MQPLVWDNHACMPLRRAESGYLQELERYRASGIDVVSLNVGFGEHSLLHHLRIIASFRNWIHRHNDQFVLANNLDDIFAARSEGKLSIVFDIEGMGPLDEGDCGLVEMLGELGVKWMLIAYNRNNKAGGGCLDDDPGLSLHGRRILSEMKRVGMVVCCSHSGYRTARDVLDAADNPVIFSHSNARAVYDHQRNIPDELIKECAATGGVVGINGVGDFLGSDDDMAAMIIKHLDHMVQLVGPAHVGISLDYVFDIDELKEDVRTNSEVFANNPETQFSFRFAPPETFPHIVNKLTALGYSTKDIQNITGGNWQRVAQKVWR